ncbi:Utp14 protein-domain-containing protein, partial [Scleroderma citrinum]
RSHIKARATTAISDVYEDLPQKVRRGGVGLDLDRYELQGRRRDPDDDEVGLTGMNTEGRERLRARLLGENKDDEQVDSEDDEEVGSDDALGESDREGLSGSAFKRRMRKDEDEDKEDEEVESDGSGEFFDVLDVFDGKADVDNEEDTLPKSGQRSQAQDSCREDAISEEEWGGVDNESCDSEEDEDESDGSAAHDFQVSVSDSEDASPEALADLENFLSTLDPADSLKRKADGEPALESRNKKRRMLPERTEAGEESEFGAGGITLKLDDLLAPLASTSALAALKKSTKPLTSSSTKTKTLPAPLPQRAQERLDREAAYEQTKQEVDKWSATMRRIKQAEHLSFPLQAEPAGRISNLELAAKFQPSNELESAVDKLLTSAQLRDEDIAHTEGLKMAHLSVEEVVARRAELRMMRELAFRADRKAQRIAKIKSKAYRRIRKKQRERLDAAEEDEPSDDEARMKAEVDRARERATLRHKNTGKWAQSMKGREGLDQSQRQAITDMLDRGEKLRRRIRGEESGGESEDEGESEDDEMDAEEIKRKAFEELETLRTAEGSTDTTGLKSKSVFNMKFMQDAASRRAREADAKAKELAREMVFGENPEVSDPGDTLEDTTLADTSTVQRMGGRILFHPGASSAAASVLKPLGSLASDTSSVTLQSADLLQEANSVELGLHSPTPTPSTPLLAISGSAPVNPWLVPPVPSGQARKKNEAVVHKDARALAKSANKLKKQEAKGKEEKVRARDDAILEIDVNNVLTIPDPHPNIPSTQNKGTTKAKGKQSTPNSDGPVNDADSDDVNSEIEEQEKAEIQGVNAKGVKAFQQRDLVALAFAGDNVVEAFEESKRQEIEADAPREVDTTLPGWGSWGGMGTKKLPPKPHLIKKLPGIDLSTRADFKKAHVIISEKRDKKAAKYLVKDLPHPYTSYAQFERSMDTPLGTEWNTRVGFQRGTLPRVVKKASSFIFLYYRIFLTVGLFTIFA